MLKEVRSYFGIGCSVSLLMKMKMGSLPSFDIHDADTFRDYVNFLKGRGESVLKATGVVTVEVYADVSNKKVEGVTRAVGRKNGPRTDAEAFSELKLMVGDGSKIGKEGIGKWGPKESLFMCQHRMLENFLKRRKQMKKASGIAEMLLNPGVYVCPFKSTKPGHTFRHKCNTASNIGKLYEGPMAHLLTAHASNPAAKVLMQRLAYAAKYPDGNNIDGDGCVLFLSTTSG